MILLREKKFKNDSNSGRIIILDPKQLLVKKYKVKNPTVFLTLPISVIKCENNTENVLILKLLEK